MIKCKAGGIKDVYIVDLESMTRYNKVDEKLEDAVKWRLMKRGFSNKKIANNRGFLSAIIEEVINLEKV